MVGEKSIVYRNPNLMSMSFQGESLNNIFESDWQSLAKLEKSAKNKLLIAVICSCLSGIIYQLFKLFYLQKIFLINDRYYMYFSSNMSIVVATVQ